MVKKERRKGENLYIMEMALKLVWTASAFTYICSLDSVGNFSHSWEWLKGITTEKKLKTSV